MTCVFSLCFSVLVFFGCSLQSYYYILFCDDNDNPTLCLDSSVWWNYVTKNKNKNRGKARKQSVTMRLRTRSTTTILCASRLHGGLLRKRTRVLAGAARAVSTLTRSIYEGPAEVRSAPAWVHDYQSC